MATNLNLNPALLEEALKVGGLKTKKETVQLALKEFIQRRRQKMIVNLFGQIDFDDDYDYKKGRQR